MNRRRGRGHSSTVQTILAIAFLLVVLVVMAILLAPDQQDVPPVSTVAYQERPAEHRGDRPTLRNYGGGTESPDEAEPADNREPGTATARAISNTEEPEGRYTITGTAVDAGTGAPVAGVYVRAERVPTAAEESAFEEKDRAIVEAKDSGRYSELLDEKQRLWADADAQTDDNGRFRISLAHEGDYQITAIPRNHLRKTIDKSFVGASRPAWDLDIALEVGASISGRITDSFDKQGIAGIDVGATLESNNYTSTAKTDDEGYYRIGGLSTGSYSVIANIEHTAYRVTKVLPFRRTSISAPTQAVKNIDFKLDKGGVVWGYVTTPDNEPVSSQVVLCTSDSVVTQALSAMVRRAPPLSDSSSDEDGYYELVGVPLNEEWRLYATSDNQAPQLADPFIVTPRNKEVRVDITLFTGTNVYGQVVDNKGKPVPEAKVVCFPSYGQLLGPMDSAQAAREEQSDERGFFELKELPAGNYQVMAHKEGYKFALNGQPLYANGYHEVKNFRVVLENIEAGKYSVFGHVIDANGGAVSGAHVTLSGLGTESMNGVGRESTTDASGEFEFDGVEIGTYVLTAEKQGYSRKTLGRVLLDKENEIVMQTAAIVRGRVIAKSTGAAPENGYSVGAQRVSGNDDEDNENNLFSLLESPDMGGNQKDFNDPQGNYELSLAAGTWQLQASASPLTPARTSITLEPGQVLEDIDLVLTNDGGTIEGRVVITDGESPQGASVTLIEAGSAAQALTMFAQEGEGPQSMQVADDGFFSFDQLPEGTYYAVARHPAYPQAMSEPILLEEEDTASGVEITMGPGGALEGYVFEEGRPVGGRIVTVIANGQPYTGTTETDGSYEIRNIPEGKFQAFASNPSAGLNLDAITTQGYPVQIWSGSVSYQNFGEFNGITVNVAVAGGGGGGLSPLLPIDLENIGARIVLNPGNVIPVIGEGIDSSYIPGQQYTLAGRTVSIPDVAIGAWRVDYYDLTSSGTFTWRGTQDFEIVGDEGEVDVVIAIP